MTIYAVRRRVGETLVAKVGGGWRRFSGRMLVDEAAFRRHKRSALAGRWRADTALALLPVVLLVAFSALRQRVSGWLFALLLVERLVGLPAAWAREGSFLRRHAPAVHVALTACLLYTSPSPRD